MAGFRERLASALGFRQPLPTSEPAPTGRGITRMLSPILYANPRLQTTSTVAMNPSLVVQRKSFKIFDAIMLDEQVGAALAFKKLAVLSTGWKVESPPGKPEDWEVTAFVRDNLETMHGSFKDALRQILTAFEYGFSVTEKIYEKIDGKLYLRRLQTVAPHDIRFKTDEFGELLGIQQTGNKDPLAQGDRTVPLDKMMVFSWDAQFGNWYGRSDLERAHRAWLMKDQSYIWMGMMLERYGVPPILIDYDGTQIKDETQGKLIAAFRAFQSGLAALIPRGEKSDSLKVTTVEMAGQVSSVFVPSINLNDQHIAKAILMPGLLGLTADATEGSLARASTHFDVFLMVCDFARELLSEIVIQEQLVRQLVDFNFPNIEEYPIFTMMPVSDDLRSELLDTWVAMAGANVVISTPADEAHIRKEMKFPDIETAQQSIEDDENPNEPPPPPPNPLDPNNPPQPEPKLDDDGNPIEPPANDPPPPPSKKKFSFEPTRELTTHEAKVDFAQIEQDLDGITSDYIDRLRSALLKVEAALLSDVRRNYQPNLEYANSVTVLPQTDDLYTSVDAFLKDSFARGRESLRREIPQTKNNAAQSLPNADLESALAYLRAKSVSVAGVTEQKILDEVKQTLLTGVSKGSDLGTIMDALRVVFEPYVAQTAGVDELLQPSRLETIVRTNLTDVYNQGRLVEGAQAEEFLDGWQYSSIIDSRVTEVCRLLDGTVMLSGDPNIASLKPPRHFNCLPGDALVTTRGLVTGASKRRFEGQLAVIQTASALELSCTPNHPILTRRGFVAAGALNVGDDVVRYASDLRANAVDVDHQTMPTRIEDVVRSFGKARGVRTVSVPLASEDFHGDAGEGEVASVSSNRLLPNRLVSALLEKFRELVLVFGAQAEVAFERFTLTRLCAEGNLCLATFGPANGGVRALVSGGAGSQLAPDLAQEALNDSSRDAALVRDILGGKTGAIEFERIVRAECRDFAGHVYNLETDGGYYVAQGVIVHNCRSVLVPIVVGETIDPDSLITPAIAQSADALSGKGF